MKCNFCGSKDFDKEGRIWTCTSCSAEHVMDKTLTRVVSVHLEKKGSGNYNINISGDSKIHGMCIGDNARITQTIVTSGSNISGVTQRVSRAGRIIQQIINED